MEHVGEPEGGGPVAEEWAGGDVEDLREGNETVEAGEHGGDLGLVGVGFDVEEDDVLDGFRRRRRGGGGGGDGGGGHFEVGRGERVAAEGEKGVEAKAAGGEVGDGWGGEEWPSSCAKHLWVL